MQVKLISYTKSVIDEMTPEQIIVYCARVSNPQNQSNHETAPKLLDYLIENKHWSPFELVDTTFEITTSRAIAQQLLRHRSFSFQEFSQRYAAVTTLEPVEFRIQAVKNRQSSTEAIDDHELEAIAKDALDVALEAYNILIARGVAKETARFVLPLCTQTRLYMKGSLRSWIHFLEVRNHPHAQKEIQLVAQEIQKFLKGLFPNVADAVGW